MPNYIDQTFRQTRNEAAVSWGPLNEKICDHDEDEAEKLS